MNYDVFQQMQSGAWRRAEQESQQSFMERTFIALCGTEKNGEKALINDMLNPDFVACDADRPALTLAFALQDWMCNPQGAAHGGLLATCADITMGTLTRYARGGLPVSTADMHVNYLRPVPPRGRLEIRAEIEKQGNRLVFLRAVGTISQSEKQCLSVTAVFA